MSVVNYLTVWFYCCIILGVKWCNQRLKQIKRDTIRILSIKIKRDTFRILSIKINSNTFRILSIKTNVYM